MKAAWLLLLGLVGGQPPKLVRTPKRPAPRVVDAATNEAAPANATLALCELGHVTGDLWRSALGLRSNALLYRRCGYGLVDDAFAWSPPDGHVSRIPHRAKVELLTLLTLSPLLWTNIRAPVATELTATDASGHARAVVSAEIGARTAAELWRVRDRRRGYVRCESEAESVARTAWLEGGQRRASARVGGFRG